MLLVLGVCIFLTSIVTAGEIIVETLPDGQNYEYYEEVEGNWQTSVAKSEASGLTEELGSRMIDYRDEEDFVASARVAPAFDQEGRYEVYVTWSQSANLRNVKYIIEHADGDTTVELNQDGWGGLTRPNHNQWISLGEYTFSSGDDLHVKVDASEADGPADDRNLPRVYADGFRFVLVDDDVDIDVAPVEDPIVDEPTEPVEVDEVVWYDNLSQARRVARQQNREMLVYFYTPQAEACQEYDRYFETSEFEERLADYVLVRIDLSQEPRYSSEFSIYRVPAIIFHDAEGREISRISRPLSRDELLDEL